MNNPVIFSQKVRNPTMNVDDSILSCTVGLPNVVNNKSSIKSVILAEILNLGWGAFRRAVYKCVQLFSVLLLQLSCPNRFVLGWRGCTLQGTKKTSWVYFAWSYFRTPEKTKLHKSTNLQQMKHGSHLECSLNLCIDIHPCYLRKVVLCCLLISYRHTRLWSSKFGNYRLKNEMKWIRFFAKGLTLTTQKLQCSPSLCSTLPQNVPLPSTCSTCSRQNALLTIKYGALSVHFL